MFKFRNILVPTDFSEQFQVSLSYAKELANSMGAQIHIIHVSEHAVYPADLGITQASFIDFDMEINKSSLAQLDALKQELANDDIEVIIEVRTGRASEQIIDYAFKNDIDLICIATQGRSGIEHFLFGSTTEKVLRKAPCPVLVVRARRN